MAPIMPNFESFAPQMIGDAEDYRVSGDPIRHVTSIFSELGFRRFQTRFLLSASSGLSGGLCSCWCCGLLLLIVRGHTRSDGRLGHGNRERDERRGDRGRVRDIVCGIGVGVRLSGKGLRLGLGAVGFSS